MASSKRNERIPDEKWEAHKAEIVRQFVDQNQSLEDIVDSLKSTGFTVSRNQLTYRLTKTWRIHKKTSKGEAAAVWRCIDHRLAERQGNGKASNVILNGVLVEPAKVTKETGRYSQRGYASGIGTRPKTPPGQRISVCTPRDTPPEQLIFAYNPIDTVGRMIWPRNMPWLVSPVQSLRLPPSIWSSSGNKELISNWRNPTLHHSISRLVSSGYDSNLLIPEAKENEAAERMKIIRSGSVEDALQEQLKLLFLQASNKSLFKDEKSFRSKLPSMLQIIKLIDSVGFMRKPLDPGEDLTLLATREELFQVVFHLVACVSDSRGPVDAPFRRLLDDNINVITRFVEWLLQSGQNPNGPVKCSSRYFTTPLQSALQFRLDALVGILIQHNADIRGIFPDFHSHHEVQCQAHLPPFVLAMMSAGNPHSDILLINIEKHRYPLEDFLSLKLPPYRGTIPRACEPDTDHPLHHLLEGSENEAAILLVLKTLQRIVGPTWLEILSPGEGLLFHASRAGYLHVLSFLLDNNVDVNITNTAGSTALHNAVVGQRSPYMTCLYLLEHGAILERNEAVMSAFHLACHTVSDVEVLRLLCGNKANIHRTIAGIPTAKY